MTLPVPPLPAPSKPSPELVGRRVEIHPGFDRWMAGDRYGEIVGATRLFYQVRMDRSGRTVRFCPDDLTFI